MKMGTVVVTYSFFFLVYPRVGDRSTGVLHTENEKITAQWEIWRPVRWRTMYTLHEQLSTKHILEQICLIKGKIFVIISIRVSILLLVVDKRT